MSKERLIKLLDGIPESSSFPLSGSGFRAEGGGAFTEPFKQFARRHFIVQQCHTSHTTDIYLTSPLSSYVSFSGSYCPYAYGTGADAAYSNSDCPSDWESGLVFGPYWDGGGAFWGNMDGDCKIWYFGMSIFCCSDC